MHKSLIINALAVFCVLFFVEIIAAQDCHIALQGRVTEAETHDLLAFATIQIVEMKMGTTTDEFGQFVIPNLCPGTFTVQISHLECAHFEQKVTISESLQFDFELHHHEASLGEVVVREKAIELAKMQANSTVSASDLAINQGKNLAETVKNLPGVTMLQTGATIAKPVIQGLHSNRIAILTNGIALEGQQWGGEHAPEIDPFAAGKITVVKGAAAVKYGVGAMGGAVIVEPPAMREKSGVGGWLILGGFSNGRAANAAASVDFFSSNKKWPIAGRFQSSFKNAGNLKSPNYYLGNTALSELNFSTNFQLKKEKWTWELAASHFSQKIGILKASHIGNLTDLKAAIAAVEPTINDDFFTRKTNRPNQDIAHNLLKINGLYRINTFWKTDFQYAFQHNQRSEYDRNRAQNAAPNIRFDIFTNSVDASIAHFPIRHWQGSAGVQAMTQQNFVASGALIPDFLSANQSVWANERWRRYPYPIEYEVGVRFDNRWQSISRTTVFKDTLHQILRFRNVSATGGILWRFTKNGSLTAQSGFAWRPPHVNELYAAGVHHGAGTFEQGNRNLQSERAWNSNISLIFVKKARFRVNSSVFFNRIVDYIFLQPTGDFVLTVRGAFPKYRYSQANVALVGGDFGFEIDLFRGLELATRGSFLRGFRTGSDAQTSAARPVDWLPLMPADRVTNGLKYNFPKKNRLENGFFGISANSVFRQTRIASGEFSAPPIGFATWNLEAGATFSPKKRPILVSFSVSNLTNQRYREYLDFFRFFADAPGVNVGASVKMNF
jgi:iron complex outermembrane recepter protein